MVEIENRFIVASVRDGGPGKRIKCEYKMGVSGSLCSEGVICILTAVVVA